MKSLSKENARLISRTADHCSKSELADFQAAVAAGGEVAGVGLSNGMRRARRLVFLREGLRLIGIGGLKVPASTYRARIARSANCELSEEKYPFELGWIFVMPNARRNGYSKSIAERALEAASGNGVFASSRTGNTPMHSTLHKLGFVSVGQPYDSDRGAHCLQVFVRIANPTLRD